ncbi:MAG TPA: hypothetical protein PLM53_05200 [Spirochaetota bacterium]|nr:hypothetical protein [Spirochaetota bacterium]HQH96475.1 hypothetical protein [Spirochaetota bacterium]HRS76564.1 hypothetical protein [Spirochaetota bacterium]
MKVPIQLLKSAALRASTAASESAGESPGRWQSRGFSAWGSSREK